MVPKLGNSQYSSHLEWQAGDGAWDRELTHGTWFASGEVREGGASGDESSGHLVLPSTNTPGVPTMCQAEILQQMPSSPALELADLSE